MRNSYRTIVCLLAIPVSASAGHFGEGFSSATPGGPADIRFRAFTIYTGAEACEESPLPVELRVHPNPLRLQIGDRIHRTNVSARASELVVEAYDSTGQFLPSVPISVATIDINNVTGSRSDWDYFEAIREGEDELVVGWRCTVPDRAPVVAHVRMIVVARAEQRD